MKQLCSHASPLLASFPDQTAWERGYILQTNPGTLRTSPGGLTRRQEEKLFILGRDKPPLTVVLVNTWVNTDRR